MTGGGVGRQQPMMKTEDKPKNSCKGSRVRPNSSTYDHVSL